MNGQEDIPGTANEVAWCDPGLPPAQRVLGLFAAKWTIGALRALVQLKVLDVLAGHPRTPAEISQQTGTQVDALRRVLQAAASARILDERPDGSFALTPASAGLVSGTPDGIRDMFLFASDPMLWRPYEDLAHTLRTGEPAFDHVFGMSFYAYTKANPASGALFDGAMRQNHYPATGRILATFDFGRFSRIADVGGGKGQFLAEVLRRHPGCTGVLADQPHVVVDAGETFQGSGVADRVTIVPADFFVGVPAGCDAYLVKHTLHNWDDDKAVLILTRIREAISADHAARLLIVENLLRGPGQEDIGKLIDVEALAVLGGRERTRSEWNHIADLAGFALANEPDPGDLTLMEYLPV